MRINTRNLLVSRPARHPTVNPGVYVVPAKTVPTMTVPPGRITLRRPTVRFHRSAAINVVVPVTGDRPTSGRQGDAVGRGPDFPIHIYRVRSLAGGMKPYRIHFESPSRPSGNPFWMSAELGTDGTIIEISQVAPPTKGTGLPTRSPQEWAPVLSPRGRFRVLFTNDTGRAEFFHGQIIGKRVSAWWTS